MSIGSGGWLTVMPCSLAQMGPHVPLKSEPL